MPARHHQPEGGDIGRVSPKTPDDFSPIDDGDAVGEHDELVEVFGDGKNGATSQALLQEQPMDGLDGADIEPTLSIAGHPGDP
jgi:hypothetical protein